MRDGGFDGDFFTFETKHSDIEEELALSWFAAWTARTALNPRSKCSSRDPANS